MLLKSAAIASMAFLACSPVVAQGVRENFDHLPAQEILPGKPLALEHFRVELPLGGMAVVRQIEDDDESASGMALGAPDNWTLANLMLHFNQPWQRLTITLVMPPTAERNIRSMFALYGEDGAGPYSNATLFWHGPDRRRVRVELVRNAEDPFQKVMLHLLRGAYVDNIEVNPTRGASDVPEVPFLASTP